MTNIFDYTRSDLENYLASINQKKFRAVQLFEWIYRMNEVDFSKMQNIGKENVSIFQNTFDISLLTTLKEQISTDGTRKFLFELKDKNLIETVLMVHEYGYSVCVSSQVGCNMGCSFCASGMHKRVRNLEVSEMVLQVYMINRLLQKENKKVTHVVVMGIGEPFDNYSNLLKFLRIINDPKGLEIGARHITVSTCGIVPKIKEFSDFELQINLAVSLHFPNNTLRSKYMKVNNSYKIEEVMEALKYYFSKTSRRITFEYILLKDINDTEECAKQLISLVKGINCYINLIPMNKASSMFSRSSEIQSKKFFDILTKNHINVTLRREQGHDIDAACGQLRIKTMENKNGGIWKD